MIGAKELALSQGHINPQAVFNMICDGVESCFLQGTPEHPAPGD